MRSKVEDVMTRDVVTARESTSFKELVRLIEDRHVSAFPVLNDSGEVVGIVSETDLMFKEEHPVPEARPFIEARSKRLERDKAEGMVASQLMTSPVVTVGSSAGVTEAARLMHAENVRRMPVVNEAGRLVGIVTRSDLLKVFLRPDRGIAREIEQTLQDMLGIKPGTVRVEVDEGRVTLKGELPTKSLVRAGVAAAYAVEAVVAVTNRLRFENEGEELRPAVTWR